MSRFVDVSESGGGTVQAAFRNNYSWNSFWDKTLPLTLSTQNGTITLGNATYYAPNINAVTLAKFEASPPSTIPQIVTGPTNGGE